MACISSGTKSYLLDKYAKFIGFQNSQTLPGGVADSLCSKSRGEWKQFCSLEGQGALQITLIQDKHLLLSSGSQIHESFPLINASQWLKTVCKGDSLLFFIKTNNDETRRFRVKFANTGTRTGLDNCHDFVNDVSLLFPVKEIPIIEGPGSSSQSQFVEDSQLFSTPPGINDSSQMIMQDVDGCSKGCGSTMPEITRQILSGNQSHISTNLPTSELPTLIRLCLTDPGFPDFVEKIEQELKIITSQSN